MHDIYWKSLTPGCAELAPWLHDAGSLTRRIQTRCKHFAVQTVHSGLAKVAYDEASLLNIPCHRLAFSREVFLIADGQPVVFAHSTCALAHLRGAWGAVRGLGNRPLGELLFTHPLVLRHPLHYKLLHGSHPLLRKAGAQLKASPKSLWARRSLFYLQGAPLLVTEVFLPEIISLKK
ncbi:MAG: chorismate lyase [Gallionellaceae bacterium]|jgi:chorismate--pyruvate lyase